MDLAPHRMPPRQRPGPLGAARRAVVLVALRVGVSVGLSAALGGCATLVQSPAALDPLLHDSAFAAPPPAAATPDPFALSPPMRKFAQRLQARGRHDLRRQLIDALVLPPEAGGLRLRYDATATHDAAQAFEARAGNCLSLVIMTAAFARHLGLPLRYQSVRVDPSVSRNGDLTLVNGHVNLVLGRPASAATLGADAPWLVVDFLPPEDLRGQRSQPITEGTLLAMFMNNRAAEALGAGRLDDGYWAVRAALRHDASFRPAYNTLGVVYLRRGLLPQAEAVLRHALAADPDNTSVLANLVQVLHRAGRPAESQALAQRLQALQPYPYFHFHDLGHEALARGDFAAARTLFQRELRSQPDLAEAHEGLAQAYQGLGDGARAARHLRLAAELGTTPGARARYADKLARLRGAVQPLPATDPPQVH